MTLAMLRLSFKELALRWRTTSGMIAAVAIALLVFLALESVAAGAEATFSPPGTPRWIVQQRGALGEFSGSRLPGDYERRLSALGAPVVLGEIRTAAGTSLTDAVLIRGVRPDRSTQVQRLDIVAGSALRRDDEDSAMVGESLARSRGWDVGDRVRVEGRRFVVKGIFRVGTWADSQLWIPLDRAQEMFGFGDDVSIYVVEAGKAARARIESELNVDVVREGEAFAGLARSLNATTRLLLAVSVVLGVAAAFSILTVMFVMVQSRRRELAILRSIGFGRRALLTHVVSEAAIVAATGYVAALVAALGLMRLLDLGALGVSVPPLLTWRVATSALAWSLVTGLAASAYPAVVVIRSDVGESLRAE
jgi:putative ABC transport system permease protein